MNNKGKKNDFLRPEVLIAYASFVLAAIAYFRPPDPQRPFRFDFLSKSISIPIWVVFILVVGIVAATMAIRRWTLRQPPQKPAPPNPTPSAAVAAKTDPVRLPVVPFFFGGAAGSGVPANR